MPIKHNQLSKTVAHALRHAPELYALELDDEGWVSVDDLLVALRQRRRAWQHLSESDLVATMDGAKKQRFELREGEIRACYGHSVSQPIQRASVEPPPAL